jgi:hypothetical protein
VIRVITLIATLGACAVYEDHVRLLPLSAAESEHVDCAKMCADPDIDSVNFCTVASAVARPYLICEVEVRLNSGLDPWEVGIEPPRGFDPTLQGTVSLDHCPLSACAVPVRARMGDSAKDIAVTGCRVAQRPPALATKKFLVCSVRTKTDASVAAQ